MPRALPLVLTLSVVLALSTFAADEGAPGRVYELRTYTTAPARLDNLLDRFREHNLALFQKHGITLNGAWVPAEKDAAGDRLIYLVSFPSRSAAKKAWADFNTDPEWQALFEKEKQTYGNVVTKAESVFLVPTDYSPNPESIEPARGRGKKTAKAKVKTAAKASRGPRVYELRTYTTSPGKLADLHTRFRDHTMEIFSRHDMANVFYGEPADAEKGRGNTLTYFLAFPDREAAKTSWQAFGVDPEWQSVKKASEADGVKLAAKVVSTFLKPTSFSPLK